MADEKSKLQTKLFPLIEGQVPDFIQADHPVFVNFLKQYYKFLEAGQVTYDVVNSYVRYETTTVAYVLDEQDGDRILTEDTAQFTNGETITGSSSSATATAGTVTFGDIDNHYIPINDSIIGVVNIFDINESNLNKMENLGGIIKYELKDICENDFIFLCLPTSEIVEKITIGEDGLINGLKKNVFVIDMTTGEPEVTRKISNILAKKNVNFVDAPVSGGPKGAKEGIIAIMAGCEEIIFQKVKPLLNMISTNVFHAGPTGSGHSLKAGNNLLNLICRIATFEVVSMLVKDGIDPKKAVEVIQKSSGRNYATEITLPDNILSGKMFQGFTTGLMNKDASIALKNGALLNVGLPLGDLSKKILQETINDFGLNADMSNIALNFEEKNQIRLRPLTE